MMSLIDRHSVTATLTNLEIDSDLRALLGLRVWQLDTERDRPLSEIVRVIVVQPGDTPAVINAALGFPITWDQADQPSFEWIEDHGSWFEIAYMLNDDLGMLVFVADDPGTEFGIHFMCLACSDRPTHCGNKA